MDIARLNSRGFTLLELLVTVAVASIFLAVAPGTFLNLLNTARLKSQIYDFNDSLNFARSEAVKRGLPVTVCPSTDQLTCAASGTRFESGWIVFVDINNSQTVDAGDEVLRATTALITNYTLRGTSATTLNSYITFNSKGRASASGTYILCKSSAINPSRAILISSTGRITAATDNNGIPKDAGGSNMTTCTP
jgi:type IV fimbrial biogenesis protein FimT